VDAPPVKIDGSPPARLRRLLTASVVIAALAIVPSAAASDSHKPSDADTFVESIGVNTHTYYSDTVYGEQFGTVKQRLAELGVRHIRENLEPERPDQYQGLRELAGMGVKSTLILGDPSGGTEELDTLTSILGSELQGAVDAVEGPNEFDTRGGSDWQPRLAEYQQQLYDKVKGNPALASLPVIGPSIIHRQSQEAMGDIPGMLDYGNIHSYPNGEAPEGNLTPYLEHAATNSGSKPVMATETGYHNALNWNGEHNPTSEEAAATYLPRLFLEYFRRGVSRTFSYELLDEKPDPGLGDRESNFGLLHNDLSPKPAFVALRNMIEILRDPGPSFEGSPIDYTVSGDRGGLHEVLLQKRDGSFYLALWRASSVWDPTSRANVAAPEGTVDVELQRTVSSAVEYVPNVSPDPVATLPAGTNQLEVKVGAQAVVVKIVPGGKVQPGRIQLWLSKHSVPAGGRVAIKGRLPKQMTGHSLPVKIQRLGKHGWGTVGRSHTSKSGVFRKKIRVPARAGARASRLRVVARTAKPSKSVRLRIRS
jgi:hypothetical protein